MAEEVKRRVYGRRFGRKLRDSQKDLLADVLPKVRVPTLTPGAVLDPASLFAAPKRDFWLEIGFGGGEHLVAQAKAHPDTGFIGCEPFVEGVAKAIAGIEDNALTNVRLWPDDARRLIAAFPDASLARAIILFPDPWPKRRQQKRRLVQPEFVSELVRVLAPGARLRFATDVASYADEALLALLGNGALTWTATRADDWRRPPPDHVTTRYESKRLGDCDPVWYDLVRT